MNKLLSIGFITVSALQVTFVFLMLLDKIDWPWWAIWSPCGIAIAASLIAIEAQVMYRIVNNK